MTTSLRSVFADCAFPASTDVVVIGGGIVGVVAALTLAERKISVALLEKGIIAGEQSSRNLGWIRKTSRDIADLPLAVEADRLWAEMPKRIGCEVGYERCGVMFLGQKDEEMAVHERWVSEAEAYNTGTCLLSSKEVDRLVPHGKRRWAGGIYTASDGKAEPAIAVSAMAEAALRKGAKIFQNCAVRTISTAGGKIDGVITEKGKIECSNVLLAGGIWSRRFLGNLGISLPTLPLVCHVLRTHPMEGPTHISVGGPDFSFRKHQDGGYVITQRSALNAPLTLDHLLIGWKYARQLRDQYKFLRISLGADFSRDLMLGRSWDSDKTSPFERVRTNNPEVENSLIEEALENLGKAWPAFKESSIAESWAGVIDVTPDSNPMIDNVAELPGLTVATGFSGHGFGTGPAAGQLAADLVGNCTPLVSPDIYKFSR